MRERIFCAVVLALVTTAAMSEPNPYKSYGLWVVIENRDKMTDEVTYGLLYSDPDNALLVVPNLAGKQGVHYVKAAEHDFPGKTMRARVDKKEALDLGEGTSNTATLVAQMLVGQVVLVEYYKWPDDSRRYVEVPLTDFARAWEDFMAPPARPGGDPQSPPSHR